MSFSAESLSAFRACKHGVKGYMMRVNGAAVAVADTASELDVVCNEWQALTGSQCGTIELVAPDGRVYAD